VSDALALLGLSALVAEGAANATRADFPSPYQGLLVHIDEAAPTKGAASVLRLVLGSLSKAKAPDVLASLEPLGFVGEGDLNALRLEDVTYRALSPYQPARANL
jgi:hypothetical protein